LHAIEALEVQERSKRSTASPADGKPPAGGENLQMGGGKGGNRTLDPGIMSAVL
jgi:hypothetical protein